MAGLAPKRATAASAMETSVSPGGSVMYQATPAG